MYNALLVWLLGGCLADPVAPTQAPAPSPAPAPVPNPAPATPPVLPDDSTLLNTIAMDAWMGICDQFAMAQDAVLLNCHGVSLDLPARDEAADAAACVSYFERAPTWVDCPATFADFRVMTNYTPSCDPLPEAVQRIVDCTAPPTPPTCETVANMRPSDLAIDVFPGSNLSWSFTAVDDTATVELRDPANNLVTGIGAWASNTYTWTPTTPLLSDTTYSPVLTWCDGFESAFSTFTTGSFGASAPIGELIGKTYALQLGSSSTTFLQPPGVGGLLQAQFDDVEVLVRVDNATATTLNLMTATTLGPGLGQDRCVATQAVPVADFTNNPYFESGPTTLALQLPDVAVELDNGVLLGGFDPSLDRMVMSMTGVMDTRPLVERVQPGGADDSVCMLMAQFGVACTPCPDGQVLCMDIEVVDIEAVEVSAVVVERSNAAINADPMCP